MTITAATGIAALNVGGITVHRWSGMLLGPRPDQSDADYFKQLQKDHRFVKRADQQSKRGRCRMIRPLVAGIVTGRLSTSKSDTGVLPSPLSSVIASSRTSTAAGTTYFALLRVPLSL